MKRLPDNLRADCARCCALCCVVHPFDADQGFGYDKPAHEACRHLQGDFRCSIHADLAGQGFPGCASFDCHGAGQHVTQNLFGGASWQQSPELAPQMFDVYSRVRTLHELMAMLTLAMQHVHDTAQQLRLQQRLDELQLQCSGIARVPAGDLVGRLRQETLELIRAAVGVSGS